VNSDDLADATHAEKATEALLRDARSALRRVEKLTDAALAADDADAHGLAGLLSAHSSSWSITWCSPSSDAIARSNEHYARSADRIPGSIPWRSPSSSRVTAGRIRTSGYRRGVTWRLARPVPSETCVRNSAGRCGLSDVPRRSWGMRIRYARVSTREQNTGTASSRPGVPSLCGTAGVPASSICRTTRAFAGVITVGRPPTRPEARAAASPSWVFSEIRSPTPPSRPARGTATDRRGLLVSMPCQDDQLHPSLAQLPTTSIRWRTERPIRSSFVTTSSSPARSCSRQRSQSGRRASFPDAVSTKTRSQPAARSASSWPSCSAPAPGPAPTATTAAAWEVLADEVGPRPCAGPPPRSPRRMPEALLLPGAQPLREAAAPATGIRARYPRHSDHGRAG